MGKREFVYDGKTYPDELPNLTVDQVRQRLADFLPDLLNAETKEEKRGEDTVYTFTKRIGTKGGLCKC
jgi:PRTRC genetic system protein C